MNNPAAQWNNGEGWYYTEQSLLGISISFCYNEGDLQEGEEILGKVPTYEEHQSQSELIKEFVKVMELCRDTAYQTSQDCPRCGFIEEKLNQALAKAKE